MLKGLSFKTFTTDHKEGLHRGLLFICDMQQDLEVLALGEWYKAAVFH